MAAIRYGMLALKPSVLGEELIDVGETFDSRAASPRVLAEVDEFSRSFRFF